MRSIEDIQTTGAAWVTEAELAMLCAFAKRAETSEAEGKKYHDALVARHGGEPVALLNELDEARAEVARLRVMLYEENIERKRAEARVCTLEEALREYREIIGGCDDPEREEGECSRCGEPYNVRAGQEYSPECDPCAQDDSR